MGNCLQVQLRTLGRMDRQARTVKCWIARRCRCAGEVTNLDESYAGARLLKRLRILKERLLVLRERQMAMWNDREGHCCREHQEVISDEIGHLVPMLVLRRLTWGEYIITVVPCLRARLM